jgi:GNAT superfamily N-acetyltransferase
MIIHRLSKDSPKNVFLEIARLHFAEIHFGFLPLLGDEFLAYLYSQLAQLDEAAVWAAEEDGKLLGFLSGTADFKASYLKVFKKAWAGLIFRGVPSLFKRSVLAKLPAVLLYPFKKHDEKNDEPARDSNAELLSIAVRADAQGKGVGKGLVLALENALIEWAVTGDYFVTTNAADPDSTAFYRKLGFIPCGTQKHNDLTLQVFKKPINPGSRKVEA